MTESGTPSDSGSFDEDVVRLLGSERAVHADRVGAGQDERRQRLRRVLAERGAAVGEEGHPGDDRDLCREAADGADGLRRLEQVAEGLEQDQIHSRLQKDPSLLLEDLAHLRELQACRRA